MGKNYRETRERLRRLLHKKKTKRRSAPAPVAASTTDEKVVKQNSQPAVPSVPKGPTQDLSEKPGEPSKESPSLENLLDFIEGNDVACKDEKKAAKRARQKERKLQLLLQKQREEEERIRQIEEERLRKEREAQMLENLRRAAKNKKKRSKKKKPEPVPNVPPPKNPNFNVSHANANPGAQMVTIKRVMEPHDSEPTVTITLRGATPKQDKVLYTLFNGKVCEATKHPKAPKNPKDLKLIKETEKPPVPPKKSIPPKLPLSTAFQNLDKKISTDNLNYQIPSNPSRPTKELTNPTSIQISNAVTSMTKNGYHDFNFDGIKLPPGITITKVDPFNSKIKLASRPQEDTRNQVSLKPIPKPVKKAPTPEVIIVSTNKLQQEAESKPKSGRHEAETTITPALTSASKRRRRRKKKEAEARAHSTLSSYPGLDIEIIKSGDESANELCNQMSVLTINPYADHRAGEGENPAQTAKKKRKKKKKTKKSESGGDSEDWNTLDNVFAPKDIDLNDGEIDDAERELEAFKLFCMQSVPLKRKEKVNLNLKDLVLKKKSVTCS